MFRQLSFKACYLNINLKGLLPGWLTLDILKHYVFLFRNGTWNFENHFLNGPKIQKQVQVSCYFSFRKWQCFLILDMINWQCFLNLAMEIGQRFQIVSLETGQCFQSWHCPVSRTQFGNIALFLRTQFGNVALFSWQNLGSITKLSCPKLGSIATFWRKHSPRLDYSFFCLSST